MAKPGSGGSRTLSRVATTSSAPSILRSPDLVRASGVVEPPQECEETRSAHAHPSVCSAADRALAVGEDTVGEAGPVGVLVDCPVDRDPEVPGLGAVDLDGDAVEELGEGELGDHVGGGGHGRCAGGLAAELGGAGEEEVAPGAVLGAEAELFERGGFEVVHGDEVTLP